MFEPFGFSNDAFSADCSPASFFGSRAHRSACEAMNEALGRGELPVLAGAPGVGKSTTIEAFLRTLQGQPVLARRVPSAQVNARGALQAIGEAFGLCALAAGQSLLIVVDDAHGLSAGSLAQLQPLRPSLCRLAPLEADETRGYVEQRLRAAGWTGEPRFDAQALSLIHAYSGGIPARINRICGRALCRVSRGEAAMVNAGAVRQAVQAA